MIKALILHLTAYSLVFGCSIQRPDTDLCVVNAPDRHQKCYNLKKDYNDDGKLNPSAKPTFKPAVTVEDLNKNICTDPDGFANLKTYVKELRHAYEQCKAGQP